MNSLKKTTKPHKDSDLRHRSEDSAVLKRLGSFMLNFLCLQKFTYSRLFFLIAKRLISKAFGKYLKNKF